MSDLTPQDKGADRAEQLKAVIATDRFPLSPRIKNLKAVLAKLEPPKPRPTPLPPLKPPGEPSMVVARMRGTKRRPSAGGPLTTAPLR